MISVYQSRLENKKLARLHLCDKHSRYAAPSDFDGFASLGTCDVCTERWKPPVELKTAEIDGKKVGYSNHTEFLVQVGRGDKGSYKTQYRIVGDLAKAVLYYRGINVGNGYKKRLLAPSMNKPLLARCFS